MRSHVAYEIAALERTAELHAANRDRFAFEAFLLHTRALRDFFSERRAPSGKRRNTAVAEEFFHDPELWRSLKGPKSRLIKDTWAPIDRQLAHLTWDRADRSTFRDLEKHVPALERELRAQWEKFLGALNDKDREGFEMALSRWRSELGTKGSAASVP
jgi:hypothetical protein